MNFGNDGGPGNELISDTEGKLYMKQSWKEVKVSTTDHTQYIYMLKLYFSTTYEFVYQVGYKMYFLAWVLDKSWKAFCSRERYSHQVTCSHKSF